MSNPFSAVDKKRLTVKSLSSWSEGNEFKLLENGEEYFPAVIAAIATAQREIIVETFILFEDAVGIELQSALIAAARRGVQIELTVDGYGSPDLSKHFVDSLAHAGVQLHIFDPQPRLLGIRTNLFRRLHRKIVAVDGVVAFIGGINFGVDQLLSSGKEAKQDYAVRIAGPLAQTIHTFAQQQAAAFHPRKQGSLQRFANLYPQFGKWGAVSVSSETGTAALVFRDNDEHRDDIERHYRSAIRAAKREVVIACAYFFPGYRVLRQLRHAARRGVAVKLILQGAPDMPKVKSLATMLYPSLLQSGVEIYEYCRRPLHAKVAVIDDEWSTIGSSNLDPLSLALNLEANVVIRDREFNRQLRASLEPLLDEHCQKVDRATLRRGTLWTLVSNFMTYHCTRHFPRWAGWLPAHIPKMQSVAPQRPSIATGVAPGIGAVGDDCGN